MLLSTSPSRDLVRARISVCLLFVLMGTTIGSWAARIPDVRRQVSLDDAHWGLANTASTAGSLLSLVLVTMVIARVGPRRLTFAAAPLMLLNAPLLAMSSSPAALVAGLAVQGFSMNLLSTPVNAQAVQVERAAGRRIMSSFHACFSIGQLAGGLAGVLAARAGIPPSWQMAATSVVLGAMLARTIGWQPADVRPAAASAGPDGARRRRLVTPQLVLLALIALLAAIIEGTAVQWSALYTSDALAAGAAAGAATVACFSLAMVAGRLAGDRVVQRLGRARAIRICALVAATGMTLALSAGTPAAAFAGFALLGLGASCIIPTVFGLAGNQPGASPGQGIAVVVGGMWPAFLIGPPLIGVLAGASSLRSALWVVAVAAVGIVVLAGRVTEPATSEPATTEPATTEPATTVQSQGRRRGQPAQL